MKLKTYRNNRNENKFLDVKHTNDRHYMWRQRFSYPNGITNFYGKPKGGFARIGKRCMEEVINDDYTEVIK